jgi:hypothetical protein
MDIRIGECFLEDGYFYVDIENIGISDILTFMFFNRIMKDLKTDKIESVVHEKIVHIKSGKTKKIPLGWENFHRWKQSYEIIGTKECDLLK